MPEFKHVNITTNVPRDLKSCSHVFIRNGQINSKLTSPYVGPYEVTERGTKTFTILQNDIHKRVAMDNIKPCKVFNENKGILENDDVKEVTCTKNLRNRSERFVIH